VDDELAEAAPAEPDAVSTTDLAAQFARDVAVLAATEAQLVASRHGPELRRTARDVATGLAGIVALLTAFVFANVAAYVGLARASSAGAAALVLGAAWLVVGVVLVVAVTARLRRLRAGSRDLEQARDEAEAAVRASLERLAPAVSVELASAVVPMAGGAALDVGDDVLDAAEDMVEDLAEVVPGGSVVSQIWSVALLPGRWGLRVATTVLTPGRPER
jgi:Putative Actinobacterial Holin-X, holin superfamily III